FFPDLFGVYVYPVAPAADQPAVVEGEQVPAAEETPTRCGIGCRVMRATCPQSLCAIEREKAARQAEAARAIETCAWLMDTLRLMGGNTRVDLDVDTSGSQGLRIRGGVYFGVIGCQVISEGDNVRVIWPATTGGE